MVGVDENGYIRGKNGHSDLISRQVAYEKIYQLNRHLYPKPFSEYIIHHRDRDKLNNSLGNLELVTKEEHELIHKLGLKGKKELDIYKARQENRPLLQQSYESPYSRRKKIIWNIRKARHAIHGDQSKIQKLNEIRDKYTERELRKHHAMKHKWRKRPSLAKVGVILTIISTILITIVLLEPYRNNFRIVYEIFLGSYYIVYWTGVISLYVLFVSGFFYSDKEPIIYSILELGTRILSLGGSAILCFQIFVKATIMHRMNGQVGAMIILLIVLGLVVLISFGGVGSGEKWSFSGTVTRES